MEASLSLRPKHKFRFPIIANDLTPELLEGKSVEEIRELQIWEGNKQKEIGDLFIVEKDEKVQTPEAATVTIRGDLSKVRRIGAGMTSGQVIIHGDAGMHLGQEMEDGRITVHGNVGGWAGSMMKGGTIEIHGNAGDYLGAPYRGTRRGMRGGRIIVHGNAGNEAGAHMTKGTMKIYGSAGQFCGLRMQKGTIYIEKDCQERVGACMTGGKIVVGGFLKSVLPTFSIEEVRGKVKIEDGEVASGPLYLFIGDHTESGSGKLFVSKNKNPHLNHYERLL